MNIKKNKIKNLFVCIFACFISIFAFSGCGGSEWSNADIVADGMIRAEEVSENGLVAEELSFRVTDSRNSGETVYYKCASDFIADCGFEEEETFWEYYTEEGSLQLVLYYDEASKEGCGIRYYPEEEDKKEEGFRFFCGLSEEPQYSVMEAWADLVKNGTLSYRRSTGKTAVSGYEESRECFENWPYDMKHFASEGSVESDEAGSVSDLVEIDWIYRNDETLQRKECRYNAQVFGTYRSSVDYYYGKDERLLYQEFYITHGSGEVYYIYGEEEIVPEYYLHLDQNHGILAEMVSYNTEIPDEDKLNLDEERILGQFANYNSHFTVDIDHYDDEGNAVVHVYEVVENEDESHTATSDWITVNPDTGIGFNFSGEIVDIIQEEDKILYYRFLNGQIGAKKTGNIDSQEVLRSYYEQDSLRYTYADLNDDDVLELIIYPIGMMQILTIDHDEVCWVSAPFYSAATGEIINENKEIVMVDESHTGRKQYSVYRLNDENELEDITFFQVWFAGEFSGLQEDEYSQCVGGVENGTKEVITKDEFDTLYEKYVQNALDLEWKRFEPKEF